MRHMLMAGPVVGILLVISVGAAMAQDEDLRVGDDPADFERVEMPVAAIAVSFPAGWTVEKPGQRYEMALPPGVDGQAMVTTFLTAGSGDLLRCGMEVFEVSPLTLEEHAAWVEEVNEADPGFEGTIGHVSLELPVGEAVRIDGDHQGDGIWTTMYLFDRRERRYQLYCLDRERSADDYLAIAETMELLGLPPDYVPIEAIGWAEVNDFWAIVAVTEAQDRFMYAWCDRALWLERADGSFEERLSCSLTDDPVDPPETQGGRPAELLILTGGPCEWLSDFWINYDGREFNAESYSQSVQPDGTVLAVSNYGAEALECEVE